MWKCCMIKVVKQTKVLQIFLIIQPFLIWIFSIMSCEILLRFTESKLPIKNLYLYARKKVLHLYTTHYHWRIGASVYSGLFPKDSILSYCYFKWLCIVITFSLSTVVCICWTARHGISLCLVEITVVSPIFGFSFHSFLPAVICL